MKIMLISQKTLLLPAFQVAFMLINSIHLRIVLQQYHIMSKEFALNPQFQKLQ